MLITGSSLVCQDQSRPSVHPTIASLFFLNTLGKSRLTQVLASLLWDWRSPSECWMLFQSSGQCSCMFEHCNLLCCTANEEQNKDKKKSWKLHVLSCYLGVQALNSKDKLCSASPDYKIWATLFSFKMI